MDRPTGGEVLRSLRDRRGLSQEDIAVDIGVSPGAVSQWETGRTSPRRSAAIQVDRLLNAGGEIVRAFGYAEVIQHDDELRSQLESLRQGLMAVVQVLRVVLDDSVFDELQERDELARSLDGAQQVLRRA